ncbi:TolC family protein [Flagellimonas zhangzhouensis]|uniref:Efflux transporter, outer membrane factor (OMF) lipoprotein, NodT family n=2 Tax=Flagellimonas zhangzhouensis TaxID=1073328 RepID=A0A1H2RSW7_9FLAO|nr:TolC family protein [Allomuricauda zhangzhouensis]SDQ67363.1 efflux transporter, outer membrane factor (OMF) lipoprotein, NodT family [Allomuricauda zhangzhouensis]SDW22407.1 efflux transporter, outer membrane factor (OMF) lipoprotein, NodT family [Allomuricauda zhangzhouensis]
MKYSKALFIGMMALVLFYSCVPTREIRDEETALPEQYQNQSTDTVNTALVQWKEFFQDPYLVTLIDSALVKNQELNIMLQRVDMAKNKIQAKKGEYLPFVNIQAGAEVEKVGEYTRNGAVEKNLEVKEGEEFPEPLTNYMVGAFATWELDVWKKLRNEKKAAVYEYLSSVEGKNFMVTSLVAEIADSYYELMALDNQLAIIDQNLEIQQNALRMVKLQKEAARATELAVKRFQAEVLKNQSHKYEIQQQIVETENKLNFLLGRSPQHIDRTSDSFIDAPIDAISAGVPSQLLQNRPDVRQAEYELAAAKLDTKAAKANFYPQFTIRAGLGLEAFDVKNLTTTPESVLYSAIGDMVAPLINRNAIKAQYKTATDRQLQAVYEYEKAILNAYIEVANQLSNIDNLKKSYELKDGQVQALTESIELSTRLFQSARVEYIEVLLAQREALESRMELVETKKDQLLAQVNMYRALGGGWN